MAEIIDGEAVASDIRDGVSECVDTLSEAGVEPRLATVLMSDDPASESYVSMKQGDCEEVGIDALDIEIDTDAPAEELYDTVEELNEDESVDGILVQMPVPEQVNDREVLRLMRPAKDVDGFHPENVGRLVAGNARYKPCTPHGIQKLFEAYDVETEGADAVILGRSSIVGKPMANLMIQKAPFGNATTTVCHSRTQDLEAKVGNADIVVAAIGATEFVDGSMLKQGATVIDVGINRVETEGGDSELVGDVDFESVEGVAGAITPVPGGVGPMTRAMLLYNTVKSAGDHHDVEIELP